MADNQPATTVGALTVKVTRSIQNINLHRQAMAEVAAQAKLTTPVQPPKEVTAK